MQVYKSEREALETAFTRFNGGLSVEALSDALWTAHEGVDGASRSHLSKAMCLMRRAPP